MAKRKRLPTIPELVDRDVQTFERRWWKHQSLSEAGLSLAQCVLEYQFSICAYIVDRLRDPKTPPEVRDAFAMRGLPNLGVVLKSPDASVLAALTAGGQPPTLPAPSPEAGGPAAPNVSSVLEAYRVNGKLPQ